MQSYFHISQDKLAVGTELRSKGVPHLADAIEDVLESLRPEDKLSRSAAVYLLDHADFSKSGVPYEKGYVHLVEPVGAVQKHDAVWIGRIQRRKRFEKFAKTALPPRDLPDAQLASNYWSGEATPHPEWEYLAASARVVGYLSEDPLSTGRNLPDFPSVP